MSGLVEEASGLWEDLSTVKRDRGWLSVENKVVLALGMEISELNMTNGSLVGSPQ